MYIKLWQGLQANSIHLTIPLYCTTYKQSYQTEIEYRSWYESKKLPATVNLNHRTITVGTIIYYITHLQENMIKGTVEGKSFELRSDGSLSSSHCVLI